MKKINLNILTLTSLSLLALNACSSKHAPKKADTRLDKAETVHGQTVGMKDGKVVVQKKVMLVEDLRKIEREVFTLEDTVYGNERYGRKGLYGVLKNCHTKLADPRIGGSGTLKPLPPPDPITKDEQELKMVIDENDQLVSVSEEMLLDRLNRFRGYRKALSSRKVDMETDIEICEQKHKTALINHGLNPEDGKAQGEWVTGPQGYKIWQMKKAETLDPEELSRRKAQQ